MLKQSIRRFLWLLLLLVGAASSHAEEVYWSAYNGTGGWVVLSPSEQTEAGARVALLYWSSGKVCQSWQYAYNDPLAGNLPGPKQGRTTNGNTYDYPLRFDGCKDYYATYAAPIYYKAGFSIRKTECDRGYTAVVASNQSAQCVLPAAPLPAATEDPGVPEGQSMPTDCPTKTCPTDENATPRAQGATSLDSGAPSDSGAVGDPINIATGNVFDQQFDYSGAGGNKLTFYRVYNSSNAAISSTTVGIGWRHNFERRVLYTSSYAQLVRADGRSIAFTKSGSTYVAPQEHKGVLTAVMNGGTQTGWRYQYPNGDIENFNYPNGYLQSIQLKAGGGFAFTWTGSLLTAISDGLGRTIQLAYLNGTVSRATFPDGTWADYGYDAYRRLTTVTRSNGAVRQYAYSPMLLAGNIQNPGAYQLLSVQDEDGLLAASFAYDANGRATYAGGPNGITSVTLTYSGSTTTVSTSKGYTEAHDLTTAGGRKRAFRRTSSCADGCALAGQVLDATYDDNGNRTSILGKSGVLTCVAFDTTRNLPLVRVEGLIGGADSCSAALASPPPHGRATSWQWHATMAVPLAVAGPQAITTYQLDTAGRPLTVTVQPTSDMSGAAGFSAQAAGAARTWQYTYTARGSLTSVKAPRGDVNATTTFSYDGAENLISVTNPVGLVTTFGSYDANGRPGLFTEPNGLQTTVSYDARGRVAQVNRGGATTSYSYTPAGRLASTTLPSGLTLTYGYDAAGRVNQVADSAGNRTNYVLDSEGNVTSETVTGNGSALAFSRQMAYDALSRLTTLTKAQ